MEGATSVTDTVTACVLAKVPSDATTLKLYEDFVSKSGEALKVTAPVELSIVKAAASAPLRVNVTPPPWTSVAAAVYTTVAVLIPSLTVTELADEMAGATSVTATLTAWLEVSVPSLATTLKV